MAKAKNAKEELDAKQSEAIIATTQLACDNAAKIAAQDAKDAEHDEALKRSNDNDIATAKALNASKEKDAAQDNALAKLEKKTSIMFGIATALAVIAIALAVIL